MTCCTCLCAVAALLPSLCLCHCLCYCQRHLLLAICSRAHPPNCWIRPAVVVVLYLRIPLGMLPAINFHQSSLLPLLLLLLLLLPLVLHKRWQSYFSCHHAGPRRISINYIALSLPPSLFRSLSPLHLLPDVGRNKSRAQLACFALVLCLCCGFSEYILIVCHIFTKSFLLPRPAFSVRIPINLSMYLCISLTVSRLLLCTQFRGFFKRAMIIQYQQGRFALTASEKSN